ncbi:sigma-70 family RNA polymerase sigma factor [Spirosoma koreense]
MPVDPDTFLAEIFDPYAHRLYSLLLVLVREPFEADRFLELTLLKAWQEVQLRGLPDTNERFSWLVRLALTTGLSPTDIVRVMTQLTMWK